MKGKPGISINREIQKAFLSAGEAVVLIPNNSEFIRLRLVVGERRGALDMTKRPIFCFCAGAIMTLATLSLVNLVHSGVLRGPVAIEGVRFLEPNEMHECNIKLYHELHHNRLVIDVIDRSTSKRVSSVEYLQFYRKELHVRDGSVKVDWQKDCLTLKISETIDLRVPW